MTLHFMFGSSLIPVTFQKKDLRVFIGSFCILQYSDKMQVLGMVKGSATVAKDLGKMG